MQVIKTPLIVRLFMNRVRHSLIVLSAILFGGLISTSYAHEVLQGEVCAPFEQCKKVGDALTPIIPDDSAAWRWRELPEMNVPRLGAQAVQLTSGRVLVIGGVSGEDWFSEAKLCELCSLKTELYDFKGKQWELLPSNYPTVPTSAREMRRFDVQALVALPNDQAVMIAHRRLRYSSGDGEQKTKVTTHAYLFDGKSKRWESIEAPKEALTGFSLSVLNDGQLLMIGGEGRSPVGSDIEHPTLGPDYVEDDFRKTVQLYNPKNKSWQQLPPLQEGRGFHAAVLLKNGQVLVMGGVIDYQRGGGKLSQTIAAKTVELFDPETQSWATVAPMNIPRSFISALLLKDGQVLVAGGEVERTEGEMALALQAQAEGGKAQMDESFKVYMTNATERYSPDAQTWELIQPMPLYTGRVGHQWVPLAQNRYLSIGGVSAPSFGVEDHFRNEAYIYDANQEQWLRGEPFKGGDLFGATSIALADGAVMTVGGLSQDRNNGSRYTKKVYLYGPPIR